MKIICKHCQSENVGRDAWAEWDGEKWVLRSVFDNAYCFDCAGDTSLEEVGGENEQS